MKTAHIFCFLFLCTYSLFSQGNSLLLSERTSTTATVADDETDTKIARMKAAFSSFSIGLEGGIGINMFAQEIKSVPYGDETQFKKVFGRGTGIGEYLNLVADIGLSYKYGLQLKVGHQNLYVANSGTIDNLKLRDGTSGKEVSSTQNMEWEINGLSYLAMGIGFRVNTTPELSILLGGSVNVLKQNDPEFEQTNTIITPENAVFETQPGRAGKKATLKETMYGTSNDIIAVEISVAYRFELYKSVVLVPKIGFQHFISGLYSSYSQIDNSMNTIQIGVSLRYNM